MFDCSPTPDPPAEAYGVWGEKSCTCKKYMGIVRSAFLIDEQGKVQPRLAEDQPQGHPENLLKALAES